ncbi:type II toxin-antitoxin system HicA family toxin [Rhizobium sp. NFR03]|uniref:type II toxin-antitoxin system HicA family toxin n=1 Tax=Rhizobium sp. NFR03 TaxID=1566263 RepID=UPI0008AC0C00|nr:type II toxin-antitoxin system HicA family toxin [Rhizobium sp. NFR03]SES16469.1 HicA toxin of toxin-antitoxin [Rhizobium sp. NFR03]
MNNRHRKILLSVFAEPVSGTIAWADIEALRIALGCEILEGSGSRVRFISGSEIESFHRPHPAKEAKRYQVRAARDFIKRIGGQP